MRDADGVVDALGVLEGDVVAVGGGVPVCEGVVPAVMDADEEAVTDADEDAVHELVCVNAAVNEAVLLGVEVCIGVPVAVADCVPVGLANAGTSSTARN